jgi:hypothetical protein
LLLFALQSITSQRLQSENGYKESVEKQQTMKSVRLNRIPKSAAILSIVRTFYRNINWPIRLLPLFKLDQFGRRIVRSFLFVRVPPVRDCDLVACEKWRPFHSRPDYMIRLERNA